MIDDRARSACLPSPATIDGRRQVPSPSRLRSGALLLLLAAAVAGALRAQGEAPGMMAYQGRLVESGQLVNSAGLMLRLSIYAMPEGGASLYTELDEVVVVDGLYSTVIGDNRAAGTAASLPSALALAGTNAWLGVTVLGNAEFAPRTRLLSAPYAMNAVTTGELGPLAYPGASAFVIVDTTDDETANGLNLIAAYNRARALTPNGAARGTANRAAVLVLPARYNLGTFELVLNESCIDLVGVSTAPGAQYIFGTAGSGYGVIRQTADDVHLENLDVVCTRSSGVAAGNSFDRAAYFPESALPLTVIRDCRFTATVPLYARPMRTHITYAGTYERCTSGAYGFGYGGAAAGTFRWCTGGTASFGGTGGTVSGALTGCTMNGSSWGGTLTGTMDACDWGATVAVAGAGRVLRSMIAGKYRHDGDMAIEGTLTGGGLGPLARVAGSAFVVVETSDSDTVNGQNLVDAYTRAAGMTPHGMALSGSNRVAVLVPPGRYNLGSSALTLSANYVDVVGLSSVREEQYIFGVTAGIVSGVIRQSADDVRIENLFVECTRSTGLLTQAATDPAAYYANGGLSRTVIRNCRFNATHDGVYGWSMNIFAACAGTYENVVAGWKSFGYGTYASGRFVSCTGGQDSFGSGGTASGTFTDCNGGPFSFGGSRSNTGQATGTFRRCSHANDDGSVLTLWGGTFSGRMEDCTWRAPLAIASGAVIYNSTIAGTISSVGSGSCRIAHTRCRVLTLGSLGNAIVSPANVVDSDIE